jgi:RNA polymerase sigma-70 factor (ECF subfamily)
MQNPLRQLQDAVLAERINQGDADAFSEAYDRYAQRLYRHLLLRTSQKEIAEDLLSKVFLNAWEYVRGGKTLRYLQSFLYTVTNNVLTDHYRRNATAPIPVEDVTLYDRPDPSETEPMIDATFDRAVVHGALGKLKPIFRDVLVLKYVDELDIPEMAEVLETSPNAIYVRLHRALKALHEVLKHDYESKIR